MTCWTRPQILCYGLHLRSDQNESTNTNRCKRSAANCGRLVSTYNPCRFCLRGHTCKWGFDVRVYANSVAGSLRIRDGGDKESSAAAGHADRVFASNRGDDAIAGVADGRRRLVAVRWSTCEWRCNRRNLTQFRRRHRNLLLTILCHKKCCLGFIGVDEAEVTEWMRKHRDTLTPKWTQ